jgi:hypothetical protein
MGEVMKMMPTLSMDLTPTMMMMMTMTTKTSR